MRLNLRFYSQRLLAAYYSMRFTRGKQALLSVSADLLSWEKPKSGLSLLLGSHRGEDERVCVRVHVCVHQALLPKLEVR